MKTRYALTLSAASLALAAIAGCAAPVTEDSPAWNCATMGNQICGPTTDDDRGAAWNVWEYSNGAAKLKMDPARSFRVEYVGTSESIPRNLAENEVALVGKDFQWYVFKADYTTGK